MSEASSSGMPEGQEPARLAAEELSALFSETDEDLPNSVLHGLPNPERVIKAHTLLLEVMFPGRNDPEGEGLLPLPRYLNDMLAQAWEVMLPEVERAIPFRWKAAASVQCGGAADVPDAGTVKAEAKRVLGEFYKRLPAVRRLLTDDVQAAYAGDPAARTYAEIMLAYPGRLAVASHRLAHELYNLDLPLVPRIMSEWTHSRTGVDIHPGARIGRGFFIDHATGVVIGETATIGNGVKLYQGVTLGAKSFDLDEHGLPIKGVQRHPTVEDGVVVYSNATILGGSTVIGKGSIVGGNVFLTESVPPGSIVLRDSAQPRIKPANRNS